MVSPIVGFPNKDPYIRYPGCNEREREREREGENKVPLISKTPKCTRKEVGV